jgi:hypothetical protein
VRQHTQRRKSLAPRLRCSQRAERRSRRPWQLGSPGDLTLRALTTYPRFQQRVALEFSGIVTALIRALSSHRYAFSHRPAGASASLRFELRAGAGLLEAHHEAGHHEKAAHRAHLSRAIAKR